MEIRCEKQTCLHNTGCSCKAGSVQVDRSHHCCSFTESDLKQDLIENNGNIFSVAVGDEVQHVLNVPLSCTAKSCIYNKSDCCTASGISVTHDEKTAECATYCKA
ncbi:MAG: DUF1540 domain-containing protein [Firmicutes bacterium]|nr:DUF1540 domain-containing protein [Bacillota bacterium]